ncbi:MAG: hypothetical protein ACD_7C00125G0004 [uncultured bacterium]|nr:MAG: hypothetical protein ACD_7C00125G0004 [uncultured bacterium]KKP72227.1 MAG: hypothetical protein UR65_C0019G0010 [Candidatus Moranbacteria bacterium GW2011_GWE2_35_164]KKP83897.1 MAG: hypothetical protein UR83_C0031G0010 [Candidatus Moranbacteria bacterium GW2011_GWF2_35_54]
MKTENVDLLVGMILTTLVFFLLAWIMANDKDASYQELRKEYFWICLCAGWISNITFLTASIYKYFVNHNTATVLWIIILICLAFASGFLTKILYAQYRSSIHNKNRIPKGEKNESK